LSTFQSCNFEVLVNRKLPPSNRFTECKPEPASLSTASRSRSPLDGRDPRHAAKPMHAGKTSAEVADVSGQAAEAAGKAAGMSEVQAAEAAGKAAGMSEVQAAAAAVEPCTPDLQALLDEFRRAKNEDRGGRNSVYWAVRKQYGEEAAKPFYVPKFNNSFKSDSSSGKAPTTASSPTPAPAASSASARWVMNGAPINPPPPAVCRGSLPAINPPPPAVRRLLSSPHVCTKGFRYVENPVWLSLFP